MALIAGQSKMSTCEGKPPPLGYSGEIIQTVGNDRSSDDFIWKMKYMAERHGYTGQRQPSDDLPAKQVGDGAV
jgi:hypothetical protein